MNTNSLGDLYTHEQRMASETAPGHVQLPIPHTQISGLPTLAPQNSGVAVSTTGSSTVGKTVTVANNSNLVGFVRQHGSCVVVRFNNINTATNPTLDYLETGHLPMVLRGGALPVRSIVAGVDYVFLCENDERWVLLNPTLADGSQPVTVNTQPATAHRIVTVNAGIVENSIIIVQFNQAVTGPNPTLNANSEGADPIQSGGVNIQTVGVSEFSALIPAGHRAYFKKQGETWQLLNPARPRSVWVPVGTSVGASARAVLFENGMVLVSGFTGSGENVGTLPSGFRPMAAIPQSAASNNVGIATSGAITAQASSNRPFWITFLTQGAMPI